MTDTTERVAPTGRSGLAAMNVADLKRLASGLGVTGTTKMRKDDLVAAITARQVGSAPRSEQSTQPRPQAAPSSERTDEPADAGSLLTAPEARSEERRPAAENRDRSDRPDRQQDRPQQERPQQDRPQQDRPQQERPDRQTRQQADRPTDRQSNRPPGQQGPGPTSGQGAQSVGSTDDEAPELPAT